MESIVAKLRLEFDTPTLTSEFFKSPRFVKATLKAATFSYGIFCLSACLLMRKGKSINRGYLASIPAGIITFAYSVTRLPYTDSSSIPSS